MLAKIQLLMFATFGGKGNLDPRENDTPREKLLQIRKAVDCGASLTRQLLVFSRKQELKPIPVCINGLIAELSESLQRLLGERIELLLALGSDVCPVMFDPGQFQQLLMNLVANARDAMPNGGNLTVKTASAKYDEVRTKQQTGVVLDHHVMVEVTDTGCGMDAATKSRIFEPFFTTKEKGEGTGLGLANVHEILERSGGHVTVDSEPGRGSTFTVFLPCLSTWAESVLKAGT